MTESNEPVTCTICGDSEPHHVHDGGKRIEGYFTVGRGQTDFQAAQSWKQRATEAEAALAASRAETAAAVAALTPEVTDESGTYRFCRGCSAIWRTVATATKPVEQPWHMTPDPDRPPCWVEPLLTDLTAAAQAYDAEVIRRYNENLTQQGKTIMSLARVRSDTADAEKWRSMGAAHDAEVARAAVDEERGHPLCFACGQCRVGTNDADAHECGCYGPCNWNGWADWMQDVIDHPDSYREAPSLLAPSPAASDE